MSSPDSLPSVANNSSINYYNRDTIFVSNNDPINASFIVVVLFMTSYFLNGVSDCGIINSMAKEVLVSVLILVI